MATIGSASTPTCSDYLEDLACSAIRRGISPEVARYCVRESLRNLGVAGGQPAGRRTQHRLVAYFEAVLRGQVKRSRGQMLAPARRMLVLTTLAEDLARIGASRERMLLELRGVYGSAVTPHDVERAVDAAQPSLAS